MSAIGTCTPWPLIKTLLGDASMWTNRSLTAPMTQWKALETWSKQSGIAVAALVEGDQRDLVEWVKHTSDWLVAHFPVLYWPMFVLQQFHVCFVPLVLCTFWIIWDDDLVFMRCPHQLWIKPLAALSWPCCLCISCLDLASAHGRCHLASQSLVSFHFWTSTTMTTRTRTALTPLVWTTMSALTSTTSMTTNVPPPPPQPQPLWWPWQPSRPQNQPPSPPQPPPWWWWTMKPLNGHYNHFDFHHQQLNDHSPPQQPQQPQMMMAPVVANISHRHLSLETS